MRVVAYYRVSSSQQRDAGTIEGQRAEVRALVASRGWQLVAEHEDDGRSARTSLHKRTGFASTMADVKAGAAEAVVCVALDRVSRSEDLAERGQIQETLRRAGVLLITSGGEATDFTTFAGRIAASVRFELAAEESAEKSRRAKRGRAEAAKKGRPPCAPPWGLAFDREAGAWKETPAADVVREVYRRIEAGESARGIARDFARRGVPLPRRGSWHAASVARVINSDVYDTGVWRASKAASIRVPALVAPDVALRARAAMTRSQLRGLRRTAGSYLLEGLATCGGCGAPVRIHGCVARRTSGKVYRYSYYTCETRRERKEPCAQAPQRCEAIDALLWGDVVAMFKRPDAIREVLSRRAGASEQQAGALAQLDEWRRRLDRAEDTQAAILERFRRGLIGERVMDVELERAARERRLLEQNIATWGAASLDARATARARANVEQALERLRIVAPLADAATRRDIVRELGRELVLLPGRVGGRLAVLDVEVPLRALAT